MMTDQIRKGLSKQISGTPFRLERGAQWPWEVNIWLGDQILASSDMESLRAIRAALAQNCRLIAAVRALRKDIDDLVANSSGVAGLHMNGDVADWESLLPGGCFGSWLASIEEIDAILADIEGKYHEKGL